MKTIGERMRWLRKASNYSGEKFGELCGVTKGTVSQWEKNITTPAIDKIILIRHKLNGKVDFSIDWLYTGYISNSEIQEIVNIYDRLNEKFKKILLEHAQSLDRNRF